MAKKRVPENAKTEGQAPVETSETKNGVASILIEIKKLQDTYAGKAYTPEAIKKLMQLRLELAKQSRK